MPPVATTVHDVIIAGGSFAGLALALALTRASGGEIAVALVEQGPLEVPGPASDPRAFALSAGSRRLLEAIGVWPSVAAHAQAVEAVDITDSSLGDARRPVLLSYDTMVAGEPRMLILEAGRLKAALVAAARAEPTLRVAAGIGVEALEGRAASVRVLLTDQGSLDGRLVVAADGARSPVRGLAGIGIVTAPARQLGIATTVAHEEPHRGRAVQHFLPGGPFALLPLPGNRSCITWSEERREADRIMALDDRAFLAEAQQRAGWRLGALSLAGPRGAWPLATHLARRLAGPRLALIGDAARGVHPIAGQGVNLGLRDVAALAEALVDGMRLGLDPGDATILADYERRRRFDGAQSTAAFGALNALFSNDQPLLRGVRDVGLGLVERLPALKSLLVAEASGLTGDVPRLLRGEPL